MSRAETHKRYEFVRLCSALTKQGFHFSVLPGYVLRFNEIHSRQQFSLLSAFTKTPFVNSLSIIRSDHKHFDVYANQWADKHFKPVKDNA